MKDFWRLSKLMLDHRGLFLGSILFAFIGAGGLGAGLLGITPILSSILGAQGSKPKDLPQIVGELNEKIGGRIPASWIDALPHGAFNAVAWTIAALGVVTIIASVANFLQSYMSLTLVGRTIAEIRHRCFAHVVRLPMRTVMDKPSGQVSRIVYDTAYLGSGFTAVLSKALVQILKGAAALAVAVYTNPLLCLLAIPIGFPLGYVISRTGRRIRRASRSGLAAQGGLYAKALEAIDNLRVVKSFTAEGRETHAFDAVNRESLHYELRVRTARSMGSPIVETLSIFALGSLSLVAAYYIIHGQLAPERFIMTLASLGVAGACLKPVTSLNNDLQASAAAATRIRELLDQRPEPGLEPALPALERHHQSIVFDHVSLTYKAAHAPALADVSLTIEHGQTVAFVGPNGSGKTTLLSLIPRFFDPDPPAGTNGHTRPGGRVLIDGQDIRQVNLTSLRDQIGVVTQETVLFKGTIRSNIAYAVDRATDEQVQDAARRARAEDFILKRPGAYDAEIGERGVGLSGGQRQRIAIARAILRDPAILILDEATSMIDADSEARIAEALAEFSKGRTCLIVAHRLSTVMHADRIVVMDQGKIADVGTHAELLARSATYRLIAENQLVKPGEAPQASEPGTPRGE